jgi:hypothetical protein
MSEELNSFDVLAKINPIDWINIPDPLRNGLFCLKDCIFKLKEIISNTNLLIFKQADDVQKRFEESGETSNFLKNMIEASDHNARTKIIDVSENITTDILLFKKNLAQDLDFKQKSTDKKLSIIEESMFTTKKIVQCLMTPNEVEEKITRSIKEAKQTIKSEINDFMIIPEIRQINVRLGFLGESLDKSQTSLEDVIEKFKLSVRKNEEIVDEKVRNIESLLNNLNEQRNKDTKSYENFFKNLKADIAGLDSQTNKKVGIINLSLEKIQKHSGDFDKKIHEFKDNILKIDKDLQEYKQNQTEISQKRKEKRKNKKKKAKKSRKSSVNDLSQKKEEQITSQPSRRSSRLELLIPHQSPDPQFPSPTPESRLPSTLSKPTKNSRQNSQSSLSSPIPPDPKNSSPQNSIENEKIPVKKQVFCKSPEFKPEPMPVVPSIDPEQINEKIEKLVQDHISKMEKSINQSKSDFEAGIRDIRDKLSWFPMNINEMKGKNLNEARIFTIEARMRMEENSRVEQYNQIISLINQLKAEISVSTPVSNLPYLNQGRLSVRHERRLSSDGFSEFVKAIPESEGKLNPFVPKALRSINKYSKIN